MPPSGWLILIGFVVGRMLFAGAPGCRKWPVAPASAMPKSLLIYIGLAACIAFSQLFVQLLIATVVSSSLSLLANNSY